jgi:hypothetical protein
MGEASIDSFLRPFDAHDDSVILRATLWMARQSGIFLLPARRVCRCARALGALASLRSESLKEDGFQSEVLRKFDKVSRNRA